MREFVDGLGDAVKQGVCILFMNGADDRRVRRIMKLTAGQLDAMKLELGFAMRKYGIAPDGKEASRNGL